MMGVGAQNKVAMEVRGMWSRERTDLYLRPQCSGGKENPSTQETRTERGRGTFQQRGDFYFGQLLHWCVEINFSSTKSQKVIDTLFLSWPKEKGQSSL